MANTDPETLFERRSESPALEQWSWNSVLLLGDAAHAMTPNLAQRSGQAIEDAVILADAIARNGVTQQALAEYEPRRRSRENEIRH